MRKLIEWVDSHPRDKRAKLVNQMVPVVICAVLYIFFISSSVVFIKLLINPASAEKILIELHLKDFLVGFFLYFVTAVDYALIVGRMQRANKGLAARLVMNFFTCFGCFMGVSLVLFLWGFAKEVDWLIISLLIFAGSVMVKLSFEGLEYFEDAPTIWAPLRKVTVKIVNIFHKLTEGLTFWIPELASPNVEKLPLGKLALWSGILPFIIGLDDFVGYMGAMTIYNVFSLLVGIYLADIVIDILIFISPVLTKKLVESPILSLLATYAFLYLMYKSYHEAIVIVQETHVHNMQVIYMVSLVCLAAFLIGRAVHKHVFLKHR